MNKETGHLLEGSSDELPDPILANSVCAVSI